LIYGLVTNPEVFRIFGKDGLKFFSLRQCHFGAKEITQSCDPPDPPLSQRHGHRCSSPGNGRPKGATGRGKVGSPKLLAIFVGKMMGKYVEIWGKVWEKIFGMDLKGTKEFSSV